MAISNYRVGIVIIAFAVIVKVKAWQDPTPDQLVTCYDRVGSCTGTSVVATFSDCCEHSVDPVGFRYHRDDIVGCFSCPVRFGFTQETFVGIEQAEFHTVGIGYLSGSLYSRVLFSVSLSLETAGHGDVDFFDEGGMMSIRPGVTEPEIILLPHRVDGVSQEIDETYTLTINIERGSFEPDQLVSVLTVTIIDSDVVAFEFTESDYVRREGPGATIPTRITKGDVLLANPVWLVVTPLTVQQALDRKVIDSYELDDPVSPTRADGRDFDTSVLVVTFPADEGYPQSHIDVPIPIFMMMWMRPSHNISMQYLKLLTPPTQT